MENKSNAVIAELMNKRATLLEIVLIAVLLSLSINLISSSFPALISLSPKWTFILGLTIGIIAIGYSVIRLFGNKRLSYVFQGFLTYNETHNLLIPIPRYEYSEELFRYFRAVFSENKALETWWDQEPLKDWWKAIDENDEIGKKLRSMDLVVEATEYFVLRSLSNHLSDYFDKDGYSKNKLSNFSRNDISDVLLNNHFLETFSKPMEERSHFINQNQKKIVTSENILYALGKEGTFYDKFHLILPSKSRLKRVAKNCITVDTNRFSLMLSTHFDAAGTFIPFEFHTFVLGLDQQANISDFLIEVEMEIVFKSSAFFSPSGWNYYFWVDSFFEDFNKRFSSKSFFEKIGWEHSLTLMKFINAQKSQPIAAS